MPGFLGGSTGGGGGTGGEITFPKEFVDPVTKLRVSNPQNLIDTDFEYGLQPTKWETVELINNTPSFFSKSGDTTIPGIAGVVTNAGTREVIVSTFLDHGLDVGIPISVTGTKSVTADGAYIINSIPNPTTFTYLCRDIQPTTASIEDLYSSIITGEFFQGSQLRIADSDGITTDGGSLSELTVTTNSPHGFGTKTPFYFLNLNSTISQEFAASNTETKSFDSSNSATAQTFDGSNTLSSINIDWSNSASISGIESDIDSANITNDTITVTHGSLENFVGLPIGTPLYYNIVAAGGYFLSNPRGVLFLREGGTFSTSQSTIQLTLTPNGDLVPIDTNLAGTFKLANQARTFAGNNKNLLTEVLVDLVNDSPQTFDGDNSTGLPGTVTSYSGSNVNIQAAEALDWYQGTMLLYETTGAAASGLSNDTTYFVDFLIPQANNVYTFTIKPLPNGSVISSISGGSGTQTFTQVGVSLDKDIIHIKDNGFIVNDMLRYDYPVAGRFEANEEPNFYFVQTRFDQHNFNLAHTLGSITPTTVFRGGVDYGDPIEPTPMVTSGFTAPLTFAVTSGVLPSGLTLNTTTGVVSGTPNEAIATPGREVVITVTDSAGSQAIQTHTYQFNQPPFLYSFSSTTFTNGGAAGRLGPNVSQARNGVGNPSWANQYLQMPRQGIQRWTVPRTGNYQFIARGGASTSTNTGRGTVMRATFALVQGDEIDILVGHRNPENYTGCASGGHGGTFVTKVVSSGGVSTAWGSRVIPLLVAGGGGGRVSPGNLSSPSLDALTGTRGANAPYGSAGGGSNGGGGGAYASVGGGGFRGNGSTSTSGGVSGNNRNVAVSFINGGEGSLPGSRSEGGFGGGGQSTCDQCATAAHAGAGGGYSGGAGGGTNSNSYQGNNCYGGAAGGGSFVGTGASNVATSNGGYSRTGSEPDSSYTGGVSNLSQYNTTFGSVNVIQL
jgi:hypothetical protein